ncbi:MAG: hypothetical protein UY21_C0012G0010 [Microgenomates group bacterium GW2011_GWA1_48_10]|nr:MAG: hypothetical protein UY21_C0012G0010 [Microgenomates group bacterium GW2011_GWA1_48_10]
MSVDFSLQIFYLTAAIVILAVAILVYPTLRDKSNKK